MRAALYADVEMMRVLMESGADVQERGQDGTAASPSDDPRS